MNEIVLYQPNDEIKLEVLFEYDTVWLTQAQMSELFLKDQSVIARHIANIFKEGELEEKSNMQILHNTFSKYKPTKVYNLNVIISVGYRVKSHRGTQFRIWATNALRELLLRGYSVNQRIERLEQRVTETENKIDFFVRTSLPPLQGIFYDGQVFDAYAFASGLIRSAKLRIVLIDNYIDETVLTLLDKRSDDVNAIIYTRNIAAQLQLDINKHNSQYRPIEIKTFDKSHDRFLFIDDTVYHLGASLKDLGKKWFAFSKMEISAGEILQRL